MSSHICESFQSRSLDLVNDLERDVGSGLEGEISCHNWY